MANHFLDRLRNRLGDKSAQTAAQQPLGAEEPTTAATTTAIGEAGASASTTTRPDEDLAKVLKYLELTVTRRLNGYLHGSFPSSITGAGSDPQGAREYTIGDDVRWMDWAVTARTGTAHVRTAEAERELSCWIIAEPSPRLSTGYAQTTKRHLMLAAASAISLLNDSPGSMTGLIAGETSVMAGSGRQHALQLMQKLAISRSANNLAADIDIALMQRPAPRLLVLISDFLGPLDWADALKVASARCEVLAIRLVDTADETLPGTGPVLLADAETGKTISLNINDRTREQYAAAAAEHNTAVTEALAAAQARVITLRTDRDWVVNFARQMGSV